MKRVIQTGFSIFLLLLCIAFSYGQTGMIKGKVTDENGPLAGATIRLIEPEHRKQIKGEITDINGHFSISADITKEFYLEIRFIGYKTVYTDTFTLDSNNMEKDFGRISMPVAPEVLQILTIQGNKKSVSHSNGKMNIQIEDNPMVQGESAYSLLDQLPGVSISQKGKILLNGKADVQVLINDQLTYMNGEDLKGFLESLPAEGISSIELHTRPTASHDAEGGGGILSINLKKSNSKQFSGNLAAGYSYQDHHLWNGNLFFNQQYKKWDWSIIVDASEKSNARQQTLQTDYYKTSNLEWLKQKGKEINMKRPWFTQADVNFEIADNQKFGFNLQTGKNKSTRQWNSTTHIKNKNHIDIQEIQSFNNQQEKFDHALANAFYQIKTDTLGSYVKVSLDGSLVGRNIKSKFLNEYEGKTTEGFTDVFHTPTENNYRIFASKADYQKQWKNGIETNVGTKYSQVHFLSHLDFYTVEDGHPEYKEEQSNSFDYDEKILALYADMSTNLHQNLRVNAGVRIEKTWGDGVEQLIGLHHKKDYIDWFPNISLQQKVSENLQIEYAYFHRITRPKYDHLNPHIFYIDPYNYAKGNPSLRPSRKRSFMINHLIKNMYRIGLTYDHTKDYMAEAPMAITETNQTEYSVQNLNQATDFGINAYVPVTITSFWDMNNSVVVNYQSYFLDLEEEIERKAKHIFLLFQNQQQIQLPKNTRLGFNFMYRSPFHFGYYKIHQKWSVDITLQKSFRNNKWNIHLRFNDIFKSLNMNGDYNFNKNSSQIRQYMGDQSLHLQLNYRFGSKKKIDGNKSSDFEGFDRIDQ